MTFNYREPKNFTAKFLLLIALIAYSVNAADNTKFKLSTKADKIISNYCMECHDSDVQKGNIRLDNLAEMPLKGRLDILNRIHEQVYSENMPPKKVMILP